MRRKTKNTGGTEIDHFHFSSETTLFGYEKKVQNTGGTEIEIIFISLLTPTITSLSHHPSVCFPHFYYVLQ